MQEAQGSAGKRREAQGSAGKRREAQGSAGKRREAQGSAGKRREAQGTVFAILYASIAHVPVGRGSWVKERANVRGQTLTHGALATLDPLVL